MEIVGIGTDIVECPRIGRMIEEHGELFLTRVYTPREVRYALISAHYRAQLNLQVTFEGEGEARRPVRFDSLEVDRHDAVVDGRFGHRLDALPGLGGEQRFLAEGALGAEECDAQPRLAGATLALVVLS